MSNSSPSSIHLDFRRDDIDLLLVALWRRAREDASRVDYGDLRARLVGQLREQGVEGHHDGPAADVERQTGPRLWRLLFEDERGARGVLGETRVEGPEAAASTVLMTLFWDERLDCAGWRPIVTMDDDDDEAGLNDAEEPGDQCEKCGRRLGQEVE